MIVKYDPRKVLKNMVKQLGVIELHEVKKNEIYEIYNTMSKTMYGTLMKYNATQWNLNVFKFKLNERELKLTKVETHPGSFDFEVEDFRNFESVSNYLTKLVNKENFLIQHKTKITELFKKTFGECK